MRNDCLGVSFHRGDSNVDGRTDISDDLTVIGYLFLGEEAPRCFDAADANDDARLNLSDAIFVLDDLFGGGRPPPSPGPTGAPCGPAPGASQSVVETLGRESYSAC